MPTLQMKTFKFVNISCSILAVN